MDFSVGQVQGRLFDFRPGFSYIGPGFLGPGAAVGHLDRRGAGGRQPGGGLCLLRLSGQHLGLGLMDVVLGGLQGRVSLPALGALGRDVAPGGIQFGGGSTFGRNGMIQLLGTDGVAAGHFLIAFQILGGLLILGFHSHDFGLGLVQFGLCKSDLGLGFASPAFGRGRQSACVFHHGRGRRHGGTGLFQAGRCGGGSQFDIDAPGAARSLGRMERGQGCVHPGLKITWIEFHQQVAGRNLLVVGHQDSGHMTGHPGADGNDLAVDKGVVGGFVGDGVQVIGNTRGQACKGQPGDRQPEGAAVGAPAFFTVTSDGRCCGGIPVSDFSWLLFDSAIICSFGG